MFSMSSLRLGKQMVNCHTNLSKASISFFKPEKVFKRQRVNNGGEYCIRSLMEHDRENYIATLLLPKYYLAHAVALRAFNIELALVSSQTSEPSIALMRLQFWRESLDGLYDGRVREQPVESMLSQTLKYTTLNQRWLRSLVDARERLVRTPRFSSIEDMETYAEESNSALHYLILQAAGFKSVDMDHCASHLGKAEGLLKVIRGAAPLAKQGTIMLPMSLMAKHGVTDEQVLRGEACQGLSDVIYEIACTAHEHLDHAKNICKPFNGPVLRPFLPVITAASHLRRLQKADFNVYNRKFSGKTGLLPYKLWWGMVKSEV